jgi:hypothetical protein
MTRASTRPHVGRLLTGLFILPLGAALALGTSSCCKLLNDLKQDKEEPEAEAEPASEEERAPEESAAEEEKAPEPAGEATAAAAEPEPAAEEGSAPTAPAPTAIERSLVPQPPSTVAQPTPQPTATQPAPQPTATQPAPAETAPPASVEVGTRTPRRGDRRTETPTGTVIPDRRVRNPGN